MSRLKNFLKGLPPLETAPPLPTAFAPFQRLPPEIRNKIWACACYEPRNVKLIYLNGSTLSDASKKDPSLLNLDIPNQRRYPAILQTSQESREGGHKHYKSINKSMRPSRHHLTALKLNTMNGIHFSKPNGLEVNLHVDIFVRQPLPPIKPLADVFFLDSNSNFNFRIEVLKQIQHLAVEVPASTSGPRQNKEKELQYIYSSSCVATFGLDFKDSAWSF